MSNTIDLLRALDVNRPLVPNEYSTVLLLFFFSFHWNSTKGGRIKLFQMESLERSTLISMSLNVNRHIVLPQWKLRIEVLKMKAGERYPNISFIPICDLDTNIDFRLKLGSGEIF